MPGWGSLAIGLLGWFAANSLLWIATGVLFFYFLIPLIPLANIVVLAIAYTKNRWLALGLFSAFVINAIGLIQATAFVQTPFPTDVARSIFTMIPFFFGGAPW